MTQAPTRTALRWHGGKWRLAPWIIEHFPQHRVYVEPYSGGFSVLLRKQRSYTEVYNDLDEEAVNFFRVLRSKEATVFIQLLRLTPFSRNEFMKAYTPIKDPLERARRMCIRSYMGFGSDSSGKNSGPRRGFRPGTGFRANSNKSGTTPAREWRNYPDGLVKIVERLQGVVIENRDALECMAQHDSHETLFYVDPPYPYETRSKKALGTYRYEMTEEDHRRLLKFIYNLEGFVVLSGYRCQMYDALPWKRFDRKAYADGAKKRIESIWVNEAVEESIGASLL